MEKLEHLVAFFDSAVGVAEVSYGCSLRRRVAEESRGES